MRLLIDCCGVRFGGVRTYLENLLKAWRVAYPEDELHLVVPAGGERVKLPAGVAVHDIKLSSNYMLAVIQRQKFISHAATDYRVDAVLEPSPFAPFRQLSVPLVGVVHDFRHELRPSEFSWTTRVARRIVYRHCYRVATQLIFISKRSLDDYRRIYAVGTGRDYPVVYHGADHVEAKSSHATGRRRTALAFGHWPNKGFRRAIDVWLTATTISDICDLVVVGLPESERRALEKEFDLQSGISLLSYLSDADFQELFGSLSVLVFPSEFEGFGLPVLEAMRLEIPVVISADDALQEVSSGHSLVARTCDRRSLEEAVVRALSMSKFDRVAARHHAESFTWRKTVVGTRKAIAEAVAGVQARM